MGISLNKHKLMYNILMPSIIAIYKILMDLWSLWAYYARGWLRVNNPLFPSGFTSGEGNHSLRMVLPLQSQINSCMSCSWELPCFSHYIMCSLNMYTSPQFKQKRFGWHYTWYVCIMQIQLEGLVRSLDYSRLFPRGRVSPQSQSQPTWCDLTSWWEHSLV